MAFFPDKRLFLSQRGDILYQKIKESPDNVRLWVEAFNNLRTKSICVSDINIILVEIFLNKEEDLPSIARKTFPKQCDYLEQIVYFHETNTILLRPETMNHDMEILLLLIDKCLNFNVSKCDDYIYIPDEDLMFKALSALDENIDVLIHGLDVRKFYGTHFHMELFKTIARKQNQNAFLWILTNGIIHAPYNPVTFYPSYIANALKNKNIISNIFIMMPLDQLLISWINNPDIIKPIDYINRIWFLYIYLRDKNIISEAQKIAIQMNQNELLSAIHNDLIKRANSQ